MLSLLALVLCSTGLWVWSMRLRDVSIVDIFWGPAFAVAGVVTLAEQGTTSARGVLALGLVTLWALRLALYLAWRNHGRPEDPRYQAMRERHGRAFRWQSLAIVFWLQAGLAWAVAWPLRTTIAASASAWSAWDALGVGLFVVGLGFEAVGDWQLARFKADPQNRARVMDRGLWRYTRHPNYFGDFCVWWGLYALACAAGAWWTAPGPLLMTVLLLRVSGMALLEKDIADRRPDYRAYKERTSAFFPWPPRS